MTEDARSLSVRVRVIAERLKIEAARYANGQSPAIGARRAAEALTLHQAADKLEAD